MKVAFLIFCILFAYGAHLGVYGIRVKRIIGGLAVNFRKYEYQVSVWENGQFSCSGVILDSTHILTAAHCADRVSADRLKIIAGVSYIGQNNNLNLNFLDVDKIHLHKEYSGSHVACDYIKNDIGVLTLTKPLRAHLWMNSLDFPTKNISIGSKGRVAGWGLTSFPNGQTSPNLVKINLNVLSPIECDREGMQVTNSQFCAVHPTKEKTICRGDSGAPFVMRNTLYGIASISCCDPNAPVVFESVFVHLDFIKKAMRDLVD